MSSSVCSEEVSATEDGPYGAAARQLSRALLHIGQWLRSEHYRFATVTPATHAAVLAHAPHALAGDWRDVFGWNRPFHQRLLPPEMLHTLQEAGLVEPHGDEVWQPRVRYASLDACSLDACLFPHSGYPTVEADAVFFGPDTYRFVRLIQRELALRPLRHRPRILDVGCGSGAGGIFAATHHRSLNPQLVLADINPRALAFAQAAAQLADLHGVTFSEGDLFDATDGRFDLILANPPYLNDPAARMYRHGGGSWGGGLSERIVREALPRLANGGRLVLYTGAAVVRGQDCLRAAIERLLDASQCAWTYGEIDPDVFGDELLQPGYAQVERIAAVGLVVLRP